MRLVNVLALINGKLVNEPFINSFSNIVFEAKAVKRGDLFIAFDEKEIEDAILNGAYGIIFNKPTQISDNEIAWIKVENIDEAHKKLLRFKLIEQKISAYECDTVTLQLAKQIVTDSSFIIIDEELRAVAKTLWNAQESATILYSPALFDSDLFTQSSKIERAENNSLIEIVDKTLFETSFIYDDKFYERQMISPLFISHLEKLLMLFKKLSINHRLKKFSHIEHFDSVYTNKNLEIKDFGSSDKVFIFEEETSLVQDEIEFLEKSAVWAKKRYCLPSSYKKLYSSLENAIFYKTKKELKKIIQESEANFTFVVGANKSLLTKLTIVHEQLFLDF